MKLEDRYPTLFWILGNMITFIPFVALFMALIVHDWIPHLTRIQAFAIAYGMSFFVRIGMLALAYILALFVRLIY